jgi:hypothetical protein
LQSHRPLADHAARIDGDQIANLGSRYEQFSISPAAMLIRVSANHLGKPDVVISVECLSNFTGTLQADGYAGFESIF